MDQQHVDDDRFYRGFGGGGVGGGAAAAANTRIQNDGKITPLESMLTMLDSMTSPNFVVIFTLVIVVAYQFRETLLEFFDDLRMRRFGIVVDVWETIRYAIMVNGGGDSNNGNSSIINSIGDVQNSTQEQRRRRRQLRTLPELEDVHPTQQQCPRKEETNAKNCKIEPAFLDPKQYPRGWMVFDPQKGVAVPHDPTSYCHDENNSNNNNGLDTTTNGS